MNLAISKPSFFLTASLFFIAALPAFADEASENCEKKGGVVEIHKINSDEVGEVSLCRFGKAGIGSWTLFNQKVEAIEVYLNYQPHKPVAKGVVNPDIKPPVGGVPALTAYINNPSTYCKQLDGKILKLNDKTFACVFEKDSSAIDADTLFKGPNHESNSKLTEVLKSL